jgi:hypothetical protein
MALSLNCAATFCLLDIKVKEIQNHLILSTLIVSGKSTHLTLVFLSKEADLVFQNPDKAGCSSQ